VERTLLSAAVDPKIVVAEIVWRRATLPGSPSTCGKHALDPTRK